MRRVYCLWALLASALLASILPATSHATLLYLSEREAFESALAGSDASIITFDDLPVGRICDQTPQPNTPCTTSIGDVTFVSNCGNFGCFLPPSMNISNGYALYESQGLVNSGIPRTPDHLYLDFESQFIGLTLVGNAGEARRASFVLTDSLGEQIQLSMALMPDGSTFFGAYSTLGFSRLSIFSEPLENGTLGNFLLDDVITAVKRPVAVDEPGTLALLLLSCFGTYLFRRTEWQHRSRRES